MKSAGTEPALFKYQKLLDNFQVSQVSSGFAPEQISGFHN